MVPPRARDLVDEGLRAVAVLEHQRDRHVAPREDEQQHREGDQRSARPERPRSERIARATSTCAAQRQDHQQELERREPGGEPQRRKAALSAIISLERLPGLVLGGKVAELRAACSARHAWRGWCRRRTCLSPSVPRRRRRCLRGTGRGRCRDRRPASAPCRRSRRKRIVTPSGRRWIEPRSTIPPRRIASPSRALPAAMSAGV